MTIISQHGTMGDALDTMFELEGEEYTVRRFAGFWCVVRDVEAVQAFQAELNAYTVERADECDDTNAWGFHGTHTTNAGGL
jgi:hypothetical protein